MNTHYNRIKTLIIPLLFLEMVIHLYIEGPKLKKDLS